MAEIEIVVDSTAYLKKDFIEKNNVTVVPLQYDFEGQIFDEGLPGEGFAAFFQKLAKSKDTVKTSQPSVDRFVQAFDAALSKGREVLAPIISSGVSGTFQSAKIAADMVDPSRITVIDSRCGASGVRFLVESALELARDGLSRMEIASDMLERANRIRFEITVATLDYLKRGGRLSNIQALIGNILNVRPIISLRNGFLVAVDKVRGQTKAVEAILRTIPDTVRRIGVNHILNDETAMQLINELKKRFPQAEISLDEIGPVIGGHMGPGAIGICYEI